MNDIMNYLQPSGRVVPIHKILQTPQLKCHEVNKMSLLDNIFFVAIVSTYPKIPLLFVNILPY